MKIAAMAAGAVGGYFGARMQAAGHDVFFIARGAHLDAIRKDGLRVESVHGDLHLPKVERDRRPGRGRAGRHRAVRGQAVGHRDRRAGGAPAARAGHARSITLQNGVDSVERIAPHPGRGPHRRRRRLHRDRDRRARRHQAHQQLRDDALRPRRQEAGRAARRLSSRAGKAAKLDIDISADIERERWHKFVFLNAMAGSTSSIRSPIGPIAADPEMRGFSAQLMEEATAVGKRQRRRARRRLSRGAHEILQRKSSPACRPPWTRPRAATGSLALLIGVGSGLAAASVGAIRRRQKGADPMKIAAMAAGAVGGYFGARMQAAGHDVYFIARGAHLDAIRKNGPARRKRAWQPASAQGQRDRQPGRGRAGRHRAVRGQAVGHRDRRARRRARYSGRIRG